MRAPGSAVVPGGSTVLRSSGVYNPIDYGALYDGVTDDSAAWQAAVNAMGAVGSGTLVCTGTSMIKNCITLPARGTYRFEGAGHGASLYDIEDPVWKTGRPGIVTSQTDLTIGNQPAGYGNGNHSLGAYYFFDATPSTVHSGGGELTLEWRNLFFGGSGSLNRPTAIVALTNHVRMCKMSDLSLANVGFAYLGSVGGGGQIQKWIISHCDDGQQNWLWCDGQSPFIGVIENIETTLAGDSFLPANFPGQFLSVNTFNTWFIHDNVFQGTQASVAGQRAVLYFNGINQSCLGIIHDNAFFHCDGGCIYWQDNFAYNINTTGLGLSIYHNQFQAWNEANRGGIAVAAIYIDHSTGVPPDQLIVIGENLFAGNAGAGTPTTSFGIICIDDPIAANVAIAGVTDVSGSPGIFRAIVTAPYRLNGINYGNAGAGATQFTFDGKAAYAATTTVNKTDRLIEGTGGAGGITLTLPALTAGQANTRVRVSKVDVAAGTVTVTGIAGANVVLAAQWASHDFVWDGSQWLP
jgi:hypothetical protein